MLRFCCDVALFQFLNSVTITYVSTLFSFIDNLRNSLGLLLLGKDFSYDTYMFYRPPSHLEIFTSVISSILSMSTSESVSPQATGHLDHPIYMRRRNGMEIRYQGEDLQLRDAEYYVQAFNGKVRALYIRFSYRRGSAGPSYTWERTFRPVPPKIIFQQLDIGMKKTDLRTTFDDLRKEYVGSTSSNDE